MLPRFAWMKLSPLAPTVVSFCAFACLLAPFPAVAQPHEIHQEPGGDDRPASGASAVASTERPWLEEQSSVTSHELMLDGETIAYTATAGTLPLRDADGKQLASVFYIAYTRDGVDDPSKRPVTFSFNGGPGAAALWVNLGAFGPKKVDADPEGFPLPPPGRLIDNPHSLLDISDFVFIDPVGTGLSRLAPEVERKEFHGLEADVRSVGDFIRLWTTRNERWSSPVFLAGESYGTTRSAGLAEYLQGRHGIYPSGIILISTILNWQNAEFDIGNDMPFLIHLPTYAATAWYHGKLDTELSKDLEVTLEEVERFALNDYALALLQGDLLPTDERREIAERVARYTGLSTEFVERSNLRILLGRFRKELLREKELHVGRLDSRFTGHDLDASGADPEYDPSMTAVSIGYIALMNDHIRRDLEFETDLVYESLSWGVHPWSWEGYENRYANLSEPLRRAMVQNPDLRVLFAAGYYDFATPYFDSEYTAAHMGLPASLRDNIVIEHYRAGHMMYIKDSEHKKFKADVKALIGAALAPRE